ncbi:uncharacterized protein LOC143191520 [Rhynchophorus ferrugineus]|uniref:Uncharacterized protein n=1 Tax=Rhynchophorus ferrugineus TaxID=354439 RepID=A0A834IJY5_RHYFE|nr:hypothetical protein GWI33_007613 [Rhynchophorus ferrugineus]
MFREDILRKFREDVNKVRREAQKLGIDNKTVDRLLHQRLGDIKNENSLIAKIRNNIFKFCASLVVIFSVFLYVLLNVHTPTSSIVLRNVQGLTYPALKVVRIISVPFLKIFPSLTDLYDESCLIENPYFFVNDMECWPCKSVHSVIDLTGLEHFNSFAAIGEGTPFIAKTKQDSVFYKDLKLLYENYTNELNTDSRRLKLYNTDVKDVKTLFSLKESNLSSDIHIQWRINKMTTARIIRKLFPKPYFLPERSGQAVERFLIIDGPESRPFTLPNTECSYVFIIQGSGERTISLVPSKECQSECKTVSIILKPTYALLYNWWYWRPISLPLKNATGFSVTYMNSYC